MSLRSSQVLAPSRILSIQGFWMTIPRGHSAAMAASYANGSGICAESWNQIADDTSLSNEHSTTVSRFRPVLTQGNRIGRPRFIHLQPKCPTKQENQSRLVGWVRTHPAQLATVAGAS